MADRHVKLNIGGKRFETSLSTLTKDPSSMLSQICSTRWQQNPDHEIFVDRDGKHFRYVLNHLRDGPQSVLPNDIQVLKELAAEANFYLIKALVDTIEAKLKSFQPSLVPELPDLQVGDHVIWNPDALDAYWVTFSTAAVKNYKTEDDAITPEDRRLSICRQWTAEEVTCGTFQYQVKDEYQEEEAWQAFAKREMKYVVGHVIGFERVSEFPMYVDHGERDRHLAFKLPRVIVDWFRSDERIATLSVSKTALIRVDNTDKDADP